MSEMRQETIRYPATRIIDVAKALSGDVRVRILEALGDQSMSVSQLAETLGVAQPTVSINVQMLEQAGLIASTQGASREKICSVTCRSITLELPSKPGDGLHGSVDVHMPIALYSQCSVMPPCGLAGPDGLLIGSSDDPRAFYMSERVDASLLWFAGAGYVEYCFANPMPPGVELKELKLTVELCSEVAGFSMDSPSDISLSFNGRSAGVWTCPGDFGDRKGKLTPDRWTSGTEYGMLTEWKVTQSGSCVNGIRMTDTTLSDLELAYNKPVVVRLGVSEDARHKGGMNLFGPGFGDYPQALVLTFVRGEA